MLENKVIVPPRQKKIDLIQQKLTMIVFEDDNPLKSMVHIVDSIFDGFVCSLIGKTLWWWKNIAYPVMKDRLSRV